VSGGPRTILRHGGVSNEPRSAQTWKKA
jgi:hypothetical protein